MNRIIADTKNKKNEVIYKS